jgi:hypothetical protein
VSHATGIPEATGIFALSTAMYYAVTGHEPWPEILKPENNEKIKRQSLF